MIKIYPYRDDSPSARVLAAALGIKRLYKEGKDLHVPGSIINWGNSALYRNFTYEQEFFNHPEAVAKAVNKLETFKALEGRVGIPKWTEKREEANKWLAEGYAVFARTVLNGHSGEGIAELKAGDVILGDIAPLYTQYIKKREEYRVHVFRGKVIFKQRKARKKEVPDDQVNWQVRNLDGGFIFANKNVELPDVALQSAVAAVDCLGLDFGAVDIILGNDGAYYVLEVNTACGLQGSTLDAYVEAFKEYM